MQNGKKIIVTGGAGFIGSHTVVELINSGFEPIIVDNFSNSTKEIISGLESILKRKVVVYEFDCTDSKSFEILINEEKDIFGIIHFAAFKAVGESVKEPLKYYRNNIDSLIVLLELQRKYRIKNLVFSSSCTVYGEPDRLPVNEETPFKPAESPYGNTKQICEEIIRDAVKSGLSINAISLRYFNPIGAHPTAAIGELPIGVPGNLVPFITQTAAGMRDQLTVFGNDYSTPDGTCMRDYIHVVDLAKAHVKAIELLSRENSNSYYNYFNLGTGKGNTVLEVIHAFEKANNLTLNYKIGSRRSGDVEKIYASTEKANRELNWRTELSLETALRDAWKWQMKLNKKNAQV
jgi:UDP-glucose 4-epimerase